jgi:hypothetical protein
VRNIPLLSNMEPGSVLTFPVRGQEVCELNLVTDVEFLALLVARTTGRFMQIIGDHLRACSGWESVCSDILATFFRPGFEKSSCQYMCWIAFNPPWKIYSNL